MEFNFDKEIDALLRQAGKSETLGAANGSDAGAHIDADAISAFAENALPERSRALYMAHLADCGRCRQILSNLVLLNEAAEVSAPDSVAANITVVPVPWYRKLFVFPNLAYTMGALVLMFSGVLGFLVIQNMRNASPEVSQTKEPQAVAPAPVNYGKTESAANSAMASNSNSVAVVPGSPGFTGQNTDNITTSTPEKPAQAEEEKVDDTKSANAAPVTEASDITTRDGGVSRVREAKDEDKAGDDRNEKELMAAQPAPPPPPPMVSSVPRAKPAEKKSMPYGGVPADAAGSGPAERRQVSGKSFSLRGGVWYDAAYSNQTTKNVTRGTDEFRRLDSGLKSIANSLQGTVVVVWKSTAYKIQ